MTRKSKTKPASVDTVANYDEAPYSVEVGSPDVPGVIVGPGSMVTFQVPHSDRIIIQFDGKPMMTFFANGRVEIGAGLTPDEAGRKAAMTLADEFKRLMAE